MREEEAARVRVLLALAGVWCTHAPREGVVLADGATLVPPCFMPARRVVLSGPPLGRGSVAAWVGRAPVSSSPDREWVVGVSPHPGMVDCQTCLDRALGAAFAAARVARRRAARAAEARVRGNPLG